MKTFEIRIKSREQSRAEFVKAFETRRPPDGGPADAGVFFTSLEAVRSAFTEKRLALLGLIRKHSPKSINQLAKIAGRDFKNVHSDIMLLRNIGLVKLPSAGKAGETISSPYEAINIHAVV